MNIIQRPHVDDSCLASVVPDPILRQILAARGITTVQEIDPDLKHLLHYRDLQDIDKAATLLADAVMAKKAIRVMGDYDVDGMTGTALGVRCLQAMGLERTKISYHVPSRYDDGYGLSCKMVEQAKADGVELILTVDNGIGCHDSVARAKELGLLVVVTDHHEPGENLPPADAVVNPKRHDDNFASKCLCGVGVLFYVMIALRATLAARGYFSAARPAPILGQFLDLVAIGTIGDVVPLDANNRRLVRAGLKRMQALSAQPGVVALAEIARVNLRTLSTYNIAFDLCPRLNAAGRLKLPDNPAVACLMTDDSVAARDLALRLDMCNRRRGDYEKVFLAEAKADAAASVQQHALTVFRPQWLEGIAGLIASRLKDQYNRPCFVFAGAGETITGSARSVPGFPLAKVLADIDAAHPGLLLRCGGHNMAAGATIPVARLEEFRSLFDESAAQYLKEHSELEIMSDGTLPEGYLNLNFARALERVGPWGQGFPEPLFDGEFLLEQVRLLGNRNLRLRLAASHLHFSAIRFRATALEKSLLEGIRVRMVYSLGVDRYYPNERLEVKVHAIEPV
ncbi:MAG: single-stranded-DNA-specific exonuclease RecJ [Candidatus Anaerobiospirillum merdipullorum]|uniref:Single-stranded-DNA-specific exonuclease RecJ n=1 Tax=Candidatus Anaerobiospirillum merdipullorum TaxID=2838450 RepID=A0A9E2KL17_9GAMM|nr:single-stranded-DNA-specific exonuclease RecJ [Candidatus Anaerobiospirillum merdipullorum]